MTTLQTLLEEAKRPKSSRERKAARNKLKVLKAVFKQEMLSVGELSKAIGLSFPTVHALVADLQERNVLISRGKGESIGGRKPLLYKINNEFFNVLCVELERFSVRLVVLDNNNNEVYPVRTYPQGVSEDTSQLEALVQVIHQYMESVGAKL